QTCALPIYPADAVARGTYVREMRLERILTAPEESISVQVFPAGDGLFRGTPERHYVVHRLVGGRDLDQHHPALAPRGFGLHPAVRAPVVEDTVVLVLREAPLPLHQTESVRILIDVGIDAQHARVCERTPDPLAGPGVHLQPVGIVDLRAPVVVHAVIVLADQEHAGAGRDTEALDFLARVEGGVDIHDQRIGDVDDEPVR